MKLIHFHIYNLTSYVLPSRPFCIRNYLARRAGFHVHISVKMCTGVGLSGSHIKIGARTWLSPFVSLHSNKAGCIDVGSDCDFGHHAKIITGSHEIGPPERRAGKGRSLPVKIGDGCWIGANSIILGGARIGAGSVIGAGAVVLAGEYPPSALLVGVPARVSRLIK